MAVRLTELIPPAYRPLHAALRSDACAEYWLKGGRGSGKSSFISIEIVLGLLRDPHAGAVIYRRVAGTLRESVYAQMRWAISRLGLEKHFRYGLAPMEIERLSTGQKILFRGADDAGKSKSLKPAKGYYRYLWFEELAEFPGMDDVMTIRASVLRGAPTKCVTFMSYNPPRSPANWVNAEAMTPSLGRRVHHSTYRDVPADWLGESFLSEVTRLQDANERAWRHMYLGEPIGGEGRVFDNVTLREISDEELATLGDALNGLDFGFATDPDAFARVVWDKKRRRLFIVDEFCRAHVPIDALAEAVSARCRGGVVRCDCAEPRMIQELRARGIQAVGARKGAGSVAFGLRWLQDVGEIVVDPARCPNAAREFAAYAWPEDGRGGFIPEYPDRDNHLIDAARYALEPIIGRKSAKIVNRQTWRA